MRRYKVKTLTPEKSKRQLRNRFILVTALIMSFITLMMVMFMWFFISTGRMENLGQPAWLIASLSVGAVGIVTGIGLSVIASNIILKPTNDLIDGMSKLAAGKYDTRLHYKGLAAIRRIYVGFNALAQELQSVEMLQSDFVNNFSHEFKTPIMSMNGLISLMKSKDLPRKKQMEYLEIIEEETSRLSMMTTNILNLSKLENQGVLNDKSVYNVSEQIRMCVLLEERQWMQKNLNFVMDFEDYDINANEDLMKQVWLNIIDNAVKFADDGGTLSIEINKTDTDLRVKIGNTGSVIDEKERRKIFNKFYQVDRQGSRSGNGIGLSVVKRIVELHGGVVFADSEDEKTVFIVNLPLKAD